MFAVFQIMAFENVAGYCPNYDENTCDRQSTCYQTDLRLKIWLTEIFSNSVSLGLMEIYDKGPAVEISAVFETSEHVECRRVF